MAARPGSTTQGYEHIDLRRSGIRDTSTITDRYAAGYTGIHWHP